MSDSKDEDKGKRKMNTRRKSSSSSLTTNAVATSTTCRYCRNDLMKSDKHNHVLHGRDGRSCLGQVTCPYRCLDRLLRPLWLTASELTQHLKTECRLAPSRVCIHGCGKLMSLSEMEIHISDSNDKNGCYRADCQDLKSQHLNGCTVLNASKDRFICSNRSIIVTSTPVNEVVDAVDSKTIICQYCYTAQELSSYRNGHLLIINVHDDNVANNDGRPCRGLVVQCPYRCSNIISSSRWFTKEQFVCHLRVCQKVQTNMYECVHGCGELMSISQMNQHITDRKSGCMCSNSSIHGPFGISCIGYDEGAQKFRCKYDY